MIAVLLWWLITLFLWCLVARVLISFIPVIVEGWTPRGVTLIAVEAVYTATDPPINALRKIIKPVRIGNIAFDLAVLVLFFGLQVLQVLVQFLPL